jgi:hypothetical protein
VHAPPFVGAAPAAVIGTALQSGENMPIPIMSEPVPAPAVEPVIPAFEPIVPALELIIIPAAELFVPAVALMLALVPALFDPVPAFGALVPELPVADDPPEGEDFVPAVALEPVPPFDCDVLPAAMLDEPASLALLPAASLLLFMTDGSFEPPQPIRVTKHSDKVVDSTRTCWLRDMIKLLEKAFGSRHRDRFPISQ